MILIISNRQQHVLTIFHSRLLIYYLNNYKKYYIDAFFAYSHAVCFIRFIVIACRFDYEKINDVTAKAGTTLRIVVPILKTHPVPEAQWKVNDADVDVDRAKSEVSSSQRLSTIIIQGV